MRRLELPQPDPPRLIIPEKAKSIPFHLARVGVGIAITGATAFMLAFFYQNPLNEADLPYREVQAIAIVVVFIGWMLFSICCNLLGISTRKLTYNKLVSILRNQAEVPFDENLALRKKVATGLIRLGEEWTLYPSIYAEYPIKHLPMVLVGPGGVYPINVVHQDPRQKQFVDPAKKLLSGSTDLEKRLRQAVKPTLLFFRHKKHYKNSNAELKTFTLQEFLAHITSRPVVLNSEALNGIHETMRRLAKLTID